MVNANRAFYIGEDSSFDMYPMVTGVHMKGNLRLYFIVRSVVRSKHLIEVLKYFVSNDGAVNFSAALRSKILI